MRQKILIARAIFPDVVARLSQQFDVESNQEDRLFSPDELLAKLRDKDGLYVTPSTRIDAAVIAANPQLKAICNMAVRHNNIHLETASRARIMVSKTPRVLKENTSRFKRGLLM